MKKLLLLTYLVFPIFLFAQEGSFLGVYSLHMSDKKADKLGFTYKDGYYIARTIPNTPAEKAGFQSFDYIYAINGTILSKGNDLGDILDEILPGTPTTFSFIRNEEEREVTITMAEKGHRNIPKRNPEQDPFLGIAPNHDDVPSNITGVPVNITTCSTAEAMGLEDGDIVIQMDDIVIKDIYGYMDALSTFKRGQAVKVKVKRGDDEIEKEVVF